MGRDHAWSGDGSGRPRDDAESDLLLVESLGQRDPRGRGDEVILVGIVPEGDQWPLALDSVPLSGGGERIANAQVGTHASVRSAIKLNKGETLSVSLRRGSRFTLLRHPWSGMVRLSWNGTVQEFDLFAETTAALELPLPLGRIEDAAGSQPVATAGSVLRSTLMLEQRLSVLCDDLRERLSRLAAKNAPEARTVAVSTPRWRGVTVATQNLFSCWLPMPLSVDEHPNDLTNSQIEVFAAALARLPIDQIVLSGGDRFLLKLIDAVQRRNPSIEFNILWHSSFLQMGEPHDWGLLDVWLDAARDGLIRRIGVVKRGLETFFHRFDLDAVFVQNRVAFDPGAVQPTTQNGRVGIWLSGSSEYRKVPYNTLCAISTLDEVELTGSGFDERSMALVRSLRIRAPRLSENPLPHHLMLRNLQRTALTLYITISECLPMLPLESIASGVPCLIGPSCHLFADDPELRRRFVIDRPGSPDHIAGRIRDALSEWPASFPNLMRYMTGFNRASEDSVAAFLR